MTIRFVMKTLESNINLKIKFQNNGKMISYLIVDG